MDCPEIARGSPVPGIIQGQIGWGSEEPNSVEDVPAYCMGEWNKWVLKVPSNPKHSMISPYQFGRSDLEEYSTSTALCHHSK